MPRGSKVLPAVNQQCCTYSSGNDMTPAAAPYERRVIRVVGAALAVRAALEAHDVMPPLRNQHADDALDAVADKVPSHLVGLLTGFHHLGAVQVAQVALLGFYHDWHGTQPPRDAKRLLALHRVAEVDLERRLVRDARLAAVAREQAGVAAGSGILFGGLADARAVEPVPPGGLGHGVGQLQLAVGAFSAAAGISYHKQRAIALQAAGNNGRQTPPWVVLVFWKHCVRIMLCNSTGSRAGCKRLHSPFCCDGRQRHRCKASSSNAAVTNHANPYSFHSFR